MKKILVVGQTPPPIGGQAMMIKYLLEGTYSEIKLYHVRMCFSREFDERGKFSLYKILHVLNVILQIWRIRLKNHITTLYYPLSSSPKVAVLRDVCILAFTRFLFKNVIYHFHAAGISEELPKYGFLQRHLCYNILKRPSLGITSSKHNPPDAEYLMAKEKKIIPLGIPDENKENMRRHEIDKEYITVLFMGLLNGSKGEGYILDAISKVNRSHRHIRYIITGKFETNTYEQYFKEKIHHLHLEDVVEYRGVVTGVEKKKAFLDADVFCFPSFFSSESFGIVLLEAMMYQMPIIATKWRGLQSIVEDGKNGFLVDTKNSDQIAKILSDLYDNRKKLQYLGNESRKIYLEKYEISKYLQQMEDAMVSLK